METKQKWLLSTFWTDFFPFSGNPVSSAHLNIFFCQELYGHTSWFFSQGEGTSNCSSKTNRDSTRLTGHFSAPKHCVLFRHTKLPVPCCALVLLSKHQSKRTYFTCTQSTMCVLTLYLFDLFRCAGVMQGANIKSALPFGVFWPTPCASFSSCVSLTSCHHRSLRDLCFSSGASSVSSHRWLPPPLLRTLFLLPRQNRTETQKDLMFGSHSVMFGNLSPSNCLCGEGGWSQTITRMTQMRWKFNLLSSPYSLAKLVFAYCPWGFQQECCVQWKPTTCTPDHTWQRSRDTYIRRWIAVVFTVDRFVLPLLSLLVFPAKHAENKHVNNLCCWSSENCVSFGKIQIVDGNAKTFAFLFSVLALM